MNIKASSIITIVSGIIMAGITFIFTKVINVLIACKNFVGIAVLLIVVASYYKNDIIEIIKYNQAKTFEIENKKLSIQQEKDRLQQENELADKKLQRERELADKKLQQDKEFAEKKEQRERELADKKLQQKKELVDKQDAIYKKKATEYAELGVTAGNSGNYKLQCSYWKISLGYFIKISENNWVTRTEDIDNATKNTNDTCNRAIQQEQELAEKKLLEPTLEINPNVIAVRQSSIDGEYHYGLVIERYNQCGGVHIYDLHGNDARKTRVTKELNLNCNNKIELPTVDNDHIKIWYDKTSGKYIIGMINDITNLMRLILVSPDDNDLQDLGLISYYKDAMGYGDSIQWDKAVPSIKTCSRSWCSTFDWNGKMMQVDPQKSYMNVL